MAVTVTALNSKLNYFTSAVIPSIKDMDIFRISWKPRNPELQDFRKIEESGFPGVPDFRKSGFPDFCNIRISTFSGIFRFSWIFGKSGNPVFPDFRKIRKSGFPGFPEHPEIRVFRISGKSGNPGFPDFREIRKSRFYGFPDFQKSGKPDFRNPRLKDFSRFLVLQLQH